MAKALTLTVIPFATDDAGDELITSACAPA